MIDFPSKRFIGSMIGILTPGLGSDQNFLGCFWGAGPAG
jgi:hypothetical protein